MMAPELVEVVPDFTAFGMLAFTTKRRFGSVSTGSTEPVKDVMGRWDAIRSVLSSEHGVHRLATAAQVHGARIVTHEHGWRWSGWLRGNEADGHLSVAPGTAMAVTIADCVPVFIAHPSGATAILHSGWRGTAARIVEQAIALFAARGYAPRTLQLHLGPAICGKCYEVSADVATKLLGESASAPQTVDLRALIADHAHAKGVEHITTSPSCTKCNNDKFFSHRAGDAGRQVAVIAAS